MAIFQTPINPAPTSIGRPKNVQAKPAAPPSGPTPGELRLRSIIESAPVSMVVLTPAAGVLAANQATLALFGLDKLEQALGRDFSAMVAESHKEQVQAFVGQVCRGEAGTLEYEVIGPGGSTRAVETRAVPLQRDGITPAAFLGATWAVNARTRSVDSDALTSRELLSARCDAAEEALSEARIKFDELSRQREALEKSLLDTRDQMSLAASEAKEREERLNREWSDERAALQRKVQTLQDDHSALSARLLLAQRAHEAASEAYEREQHASLTSHAEKTTELENALDDARASFQQLATDARAEREELAATVEDLERRCAELANQAEIARQLQRTLDDARINYERLLADVRMERNDLTSSVRDLTQRCAELTNHAEQAQRLEKVLDDTRASYEVILAGSRTERDELTETVRGLERRCMELVNERNAQREALEDALRAEQARGARLLHQQDEWRAELATLVYALRNTSSQAEALLDLGDAPESPAASERPAADLCAAVETPGPCEMSSGRPEDGQGTSWGF